MSCIEGFCIAMLINNIPAQQRLKDCAFINYYFNSIAIMGEPKYTWHKIAESEKELHFNGNNLLITTANKKKITIGKHNGKLHACSYACPHAGGILSDGHIDALGNIVCPLHHYRFNVENGRN